MQTRAAPPGGLSPAQSWALTQGLGVRLLSISSVSGGEGERREHSVVCWQVTRSLMHCSKSPV